MFGAPKSLGQNPQQRKMRRSKDYPSKSSNRDLSALARSNCLKIISMGSNICHRNNNSVCVTYVVLMDRLNLLATTVPLYISATLAMFPSLDAPTSDAFCNPTSRLWPIRSQSPTERNILVPFLQPRLLPFDKNRGRFKS